ncbi:MAG TPA: ABC transporter ATP-binding protein [Vineibacter sp.]|nr:ABC transporter ATP-binding protein [Vineibacter sp.]
MSALLEVSRAGKCYGGVVAIDDVSLSVTERELLCIIGPNGAGKSSLLNVLGGTLAPDHGDIRFRARPITGKPPHAFARLGIVRKFQGANVFPSLSVLDNLRVASLGVAIANHQPPPSADHVIRTIKLVPQSRTPAAMISHGQRQWLEVGMTLMCRPQILLLDEPTAGMTAVGAMEMADLVLALAREMAVIVIEHNMAFVRRLNCRTMVMHQGRVAAEGAFDDIARDARVRDAYLGRA